MQEDFFLKDLQLCLLLTDISASLKILHNISVIINTKKNDTDMSLSLSSLTSLWYRKRFSELGNDVKQLCLFQF